MNKAVGATLAGGDAQNISPLRAVRDTRLGAKKTSPRNGAPSHGGNYSRAAEKMMSRLRCEGRRISLEQPVQVIAVDHTIAYRPPAQATS